MSYNGGPIKIAGRCSISGVTASFSSSFILKQIYFTDLCLENEKLMNERKTKKYFGYINP